MTLNELSDICRADIVLRRYAGQGTRWTCSLEYAEVKDHAHSRILAGIYGDGNSPVNAINAYAAQIRGKLLVFNATDPAKRREFGVPATLTT